METNVNFAPEDIEKNKAIAALANVPGLFWLPLVAAKDSPFSKFYCNQGFWLFVMCVASSILSCILWFVGTALWIAMLVFMIIGIVAACHGQAKEVPVLGKIVVFK
ncbi:MAG: hypothetical protein RR232_03985 [Clostridia bacterium]